MEILEFKNVGLTYFSENGETVALKDISFKVKEGEFIAILGPSGSGKTTILSLISGLLKPTKGNVLLNGKDVNKFENKSGYMFQKDHLFEWRTVLKNIYLGLEIKRNKTKRLIKNRNLLLLQNAQYILKIKELKSERKNELKKNKAQTNQIITDFIKKVKTNKNQNKKISIELKNKITTSKNQKKQLKAYYANLLTELKKQQKQLQKQKGYNKQQKQLKKELKIKIKTEIKHELIQSEVYANELLKKYGLWDFRNKYPNQLSGGMRQRVALIRTLALDPSILLLDEPFSSLDYQTRLNLCDDVSSIIKSENKTAILVTHDITEALSMANKIIVLTKRPGQVKDIHNINIENDLTPLKKRESGMFLSYFDTIWKELQSDDEF